MKIMIASGGTGGHIFPALFTAAEFKKAGHEVVFAGVFKTVKTRIENEGYRACELSARGLSFANPGALVNSVVAMTQAVLESWQWIKTEKPDAVLGFGGYGAFAVVFAAALQGRPTIIHEQNVHPGKANRLLAFLVKKIAVSFSESKKYLAKQRTVVTGYPCRPVSTGFAAPEILKRFALVPGKFTVLVLGGSQGSHRINTVFLETIALLKGLLDVQVIHASGEKDYADLQAKYPSAGVPFYLSKFLQEMDQAYCVADLVICRAGAGTVTEIAAFGAPAILIPYPFAGGHQKENALVLGSRNAARIMEEEFLTAERLKQEVLLAREKSLSREEIKARATGIYVPDAAKRLVMETLALVKK